LKLQRFACWLAFLVMAFCASVSTANAETAVLGTGIARDSRIFKYVLSEPQKQVMLLAGRRQDAALKIVSDCEGRTRLRPQQVLLLKTIELPDDRADPISGSWQVRYNLTRCGETKLYNVVMEADANGGAPRLIAEFPGNSLASLQLTRDAITGVLAAAKARSASCQQAVVADMEVDEAPHRVVENDKVYENVWTETWTIALCGRLVDASMRFVPTPGDGGTDWHVSFPRPSALQQDVTP